MRHSDTQYGDVVNYNRCFPVLYKQSTNNGYTYITTSKNTTTSEKFH